MLPLKMSLGAIDLRCELFNWRLTPQMNLGLKGSIMEKLANLAIGDLRLTPHQNSSNPLPLCPHPHLTLEHNRQSLA